MSEEIIKNQEASIAQLNNIKDALKGKVSKLNDENKDLKAKIEALEEQLKSKDNEESIEDSPKESDGDKGGEGIEAVKDMIQHVKNGLLKLGMQNSEILNLLKSGKSAVSAAPAKSTPAPSGRAALTSAPAKNIVQNTGGGGGGRRPSDILAARQAESESQAPPPKEEYMSPGLMASNEKTDAPPEEEVVEEEKEKEFVIPPLPGSIKSFPHPLDGKIVCPYCGKQNWVEQQNKSKVISFVPVKQFATKYYCKDCRGEWDFN